MSEMVIQVAAVKTKLMEISKQAGALAVGLQNAAPGEKNAPNASIQYLASISEALASVAEECDALMHSGANITSNNSPGRSGV